MIYQNWAFGNGAGLTFPTNPTARPTATPIFPMNTDEGCTSISDQNGNLIFYTNGVAIWEGITGTNIQVYNQLMGDISSTQSAIIVPDPNDSNQYYILTTDGSSGLAPHNHFDGILMNVSDANPNNWTFTRLSNLMTMPTTAGFLPTERITAIQHQNCRDYWAITIVLGPPNADGERGSFFRVFSINSNGISWIGDTLMGFNSTINGYLKGSPNGATLAFVNSTTPDIHVLPFDNSTGIMNVSRNMTIPTPNDRNGNPVSRLYGLEFSPNNQFLYFGSLGQNSTTAYIYQTDLLTNLTQIAGEVQGVNPNQPQRTILGALQLGIDGRIYFVKNGQNTIGAILNPNDLSPTVDNAFVTLTTGALGQLGLPNFIASYCADEHDCDCGCGCSGCNENAEALNQELIDRAEEKHNLLSSGTTPPFAANCNTSVVDPTLNLAPEFHFHWGDSANDQIEEHDTEVFYLTVCNSYNDIQFNGLQITKLTLVPDIADLDKIHIVPDRFVHFDCLTACSCQTREFALITRGTDIAGNYELLIEYCFDNISITTGQNSGEVTFPVEIIKD